MGPVQLHDAPTSNQATDGRYSVLSESCSGTGNTIDRLGCREQSYAGINMLCFEQFTDAKSCIMPSQVKAERAKEMGQLHRLPLAYI